MNLQFTDIPPVQVRLLPTLTHSIAKSVRSFTLVCRKE